jgi:S-adenosylmethionine/arginine decarboxylase-like enzyme
MFVPNHLHLIVRGYISTPPKTEDLLNQWFVDLIKIVDMNIISGPTSIYVDEIGNRGITGTVVLSTSHSSIHIWDETEPSLFQFDIYSCAPFEIDNVLSHLEQFGVQSYDWMFIDRNDGLKIIKNGKK